MLKKLLTLTLALSLLQGGAPAGYAENKKANDCFIPSQVAEAFNRGLAFWAELFFESDEDMAKQAVDYLAVHYSETDKKNIYYNNKDWLVEISGLYETDAPKATDQAKSITISVSTEFSDTTQSLLIGAMAFAVLILDEDAEIEDLQTIIDFIYDGWNGESSPLERDGYSLVAFSLEGRNYFGIVSSDT